MEKRRNILLNEAIKNKYVGREGNVFVVCSNIPSLSFPKAICNQTINTKVENQKEFMLERSLPMRIRLVSSFKLRRY